MITRALAAAAAAVAVAAAFLLVIGPEAADRPGSGMAATPAADSQTARATTDPRVMTTGALRTDPARPEREPANGPENGPENTPENTRTAAPKNATRPGSYAVHTKVIQKRGKSYLVVDVSSRAGTGATLVVRQRVCRVTGTGEDGACTTPATTIRVDARWTVSLRRYLGKGRFRRGGAPTWSIKKSDADPEPARTVTVTATPPAALPTVTVTATAMATATVTATPPAPTATVTVTASPDIASSDTASPDTEPPIPDLLCGAPANPFGLHYCAEGARVTTPPEGICDYFSCIPYFDQGNGYLVVCADGQISRSGGIQGACSSHGGVRGEIHQGR